MIFWDLFNLIIWAIAGTMMMCCKSIPKLFYFMTWLVLMLCLLDPILEVLL